MPDLQPYMSTIFMALGVAAVAIILAIIFRLLRGNVRGRKGSRLGISEYYEIDKARRLVLLRRDDVEHLVLIGGGEDLVIESGIGAQAPGVGAAPPMMRPAPRPPVFATRRPALRPVDAPMDPERENEPQL